IEHACARRLLAREYVQTVVVVDLSLRLLFLGKGNVIVRIEVVGERRDPVESPAHAFLEGLDLIVRRSRNSAERHIAMRKVNQGTVDVVGEERAARTSLFPSRTKHEMVDDQLAPAIEKVRQSFLSLWTLEHVVLLDLDPGQFAPLPAELVALVGECLFFR